MAKEFDMDPAASIVKRVQASKVCAAWSWCKERGSKEVEVEAMALLTNAPKPIPGSEVGSMREAFEKKWWVLSDDMVPANSYLEKLLHVVEQNEPAAEALSAVVCSSDEGPGDLIPVWDPTGKFKAIKAPSETSMPRDPEQLRTSIEIMGTAWMFIAMVHTNRPWLQGLSPQLWAE